MYQGNNPMPPVNLRCEYGKNPLGIDVTSPRFSWALQHGEPNQFQSSYQIIVADDWDLAVAAQGNVWDSGQVNSSQSINVRYAGESLQSCKEYFWRVRWWDSDGQVSDFSDIATFETAFLTEDEWQGQWIAHREDLEARPEVSEAGYELYPGSLFRTEFAVTKGLKSARAYISGLGYYELRLNGAKVGDRVLEPGQTDYDHRVLYSVYDITPYLQAGTNAVGVMLGNGRYVRFHWLDAPRGYEATPRVKAELHLTYDDGSVERIVTDAGWQTRRGPLGVNGIFEGEVYDARREIEGWDQPGLDTGDWDWAQVVEGPKGRLRAQLMPPIKITRRFQPVSISSPDPGVYIYDFGQNFTGWVRLRVQGPRGTRITLRYAEVLDDEGRLDPRINRQAAATDVYILKGAAQEEWEPRFTYHGFRYVEVTGLATVPHLHSLEGCFLHTAVEETGTFICSNALLNNIHRNVIYGQLSNLMSVPTDCPQRDERMGWMGDAQLVAEESIYNFDMAAFFTKYLQDIKDAQREDGSVSDVVPPYWPLYPADPAWGTAYVVLAWEMYRYYQDVDLLAYHYDGLRRYVDQLIAREGTDGLVDFNKYGDWCPPGSVIPKKTPREITSAFYYYHDVLTLSKIAQVLGNGEDAAKYAEKAQEIRQAFNKKYFNAEGGYYGNNDQTSNVLGLQLGLVPEGAEEAVVDNLVEQIAVHHDYHFDTGIVGTKFILDTLTGYGHKEVAYRMMTQESYPSLGYMIKSGATTVWERWEKLTGTGMNSHNHIMFGTVDVWFYRSLAGIALGQPGWDGIVIKPCIPQALDYAGAALHTLRGTIASYWTKSKGTLSLQVSIPVNTEAKIYVPRGEGTALEMQVNGREVRAVNLPVVEEGNDTYFVVEAGSGEYRFTVAGYQR